MNNIFILKKAKVYICERLFYIALLWFVIGLIAYVVPKFANAFLRIKIEQPSLGGFADISLIGYLAVAAIFIGILSFLVYFNAVPSEKDESWKKRFLGKLTDEVSAALTHFACATTAALVISNTFSNQYFVNLVGMLVILGFAVLLYYPNFADNKSKELQSVGQEKKREQPQEQNKKN